MEQQEVKSTFQYRRMAGSLHHTYRVEIRGLAYRISLGRRLVRRSSAGMLSEDADISEAVAAFAVSDIEHLVGIEHE